MWRRKLSEISMALDWEIPGSWASFSGSFSRTSRLWLPKAATIRCAVFSGGIRDTKQILEHPFTIFYKYRVSNGSLGRCMITHYQTPIKIGKVTVRPGDIIMGDIDGVICIPREIAYEVLLRAEGIERNEVDIFSWVRQGDTISEIIDKGGYF